MEILKLMTKKGRQKYLPVKSKFLGEIPRKYQNCSEFSLEKIHIFFTLIHDPQISNQIDAAGSY